MYRWHEHLHYAHRQIVTSQLRNVNIEDQKIFSNERRGLLTEKLGVDGKVILECHSARLRAG
jgi:hypothetical protein